MADKPCAACQDAPGKCSGCGGTGTKLIGPCDECGGSGKCKVCKGAGTVSA